MLLTALACCNTYWSKHGLSNIVDLVKELKRTPRIQYNPTLKTLALTVFNHKRVVHAHIDSQLIYCVFAHKSPLCILLCCKSCCVANFSQQTFAFDKDVEIALLQHFILLMDTFKHS